VLARRGLPRDRSHTSEPNDAELRA